MKPGTRLKSGTCDAEVVVIRAGEGVVECGGVPMTEDKPADLAEVSPAHAEGTLMGKRYVDAGGAFELLCVKPGKGSLSVAGVVLTLKDVKPLPSSD